MEEQEHNPAIVVRNLHKSFNGQKVLNGVDLQVRQGEALAVLGRSGTGKSVLLKLIIGLQKPDSGSISVHDREIADLDLDQLNEVRKKMGFLFQDAALYDSLTVQENVAFPLRRQQRVSAGEREDRVRQLLENVGMSEEANKMPSELSGGMKKRVGMARALALNPDILLLDEPTAGLDPITAAEIEEMILKLQEEHNVASVLVTHDLHGARTVSDRLALLNEGNILKEGSFDDLRNSDDPFVSRFLREGR